MDAGESGFLIPTTDTWANVAKLYGAEWIQIDSNTGLEFSAALTVCGWIRARSVGSEQNIIEKSGTFRVWWSSSDTIKASISISSTEYVTETAATFDVDTWHHFAATFDGAQLKLYVDGSNVDNTTSVGVLDTSSAEIYVGKRPGGTNFLNGWVDEIRVMCIEWTAAQVLDEYINTEPDHRDVELLAGFIIGDPATETGIGDPATETGIGEP